MIVLRGNAANLSHYIPRTVNDLKELRKNWARLIQKIYEVDPLVCPKCKGTMRIISFIEDEKVIRDILTNLGLWLVRSRPQPKISATHSISFRRLGIGQVA